MRRKISTVPDSGDTVVSRKLSLVFLADLGLYRGGG